MTWRQDKSSTPLHAQIEGRGNGIKTNVVNNVEIAKALERPPECKRRIAMPPLLSPSGAQR